MQISNRTGPGVWRSEHVTPVANALWKYLATRFVCKQKRSTEGYSKFKSPETRQVQERLLSTLEHMQIPSWDRTRCPEELASSVGMPHPLHMFYGNLAQLGKKSNSVIRFRSVTVKNWCNLLSMEVDTVYAHHPKCLVTFGRGGPHIVW